MRMIIGLGNPGADYENTRHNVGHMVIDELLKEKLTSGNIVKKTTTFMNDSGNDVEMAVNKHKISLQDLYVVHDDLDIKLGEYKIQYGRGPKDHNGLKSVDEKLGTDEYWHVRIGVDNRPMDGRPMGEEYVLQNFSEEEKEFIKRVITEVCKKLAT
jgi:PTH1 family peptidyl-tRNA hydrolase